MECKVDMLMKNAIKLMGRSKDVCRMTSDMMRQLPPEPSRQDAFEDLEEIRMEENRVKKIEKVMRYPDTEVLGPLNGHKFLEALTKKVSFHTPKFVSPKSLSIKYVCTIFLVHLLKFDPQSSPQVLPSFEEYAPPVTYPKELEETIGIPMEVKPLDHTKLEDLGLNTCSHDLYLSFREIPSVDEPEPQLLSNFSPLDVNLGEKRRTDPSIKPHSLDSFRMKVVNKSTIHTPPSPYMALSTQRIRIAIITHALMILKNIMDLNQVY
nr:ribonuclease H-like domain-containing protein [Tanacetum cinerariifolium]